jgi:BirA family biotin operon repressor/biotin-[acetyl-CoA-carboxylase] ligase
VTLREVNRPLSQALIERALSPIESGPFGRRVYYYPQVDSTNDVARELAAHDVPEGALAIADHQTAGRGRRGRVWVAPPRTNLLMSALFRPRLDPEDAGRLVMVCGLALAEAVEQVGARPVAVKWPNDLLLGGKKFVGILPESGIVGFKLAWLIVGMGVNVNQRFAPPDPLAETATSLYDHTGHPYDRAYVLVRIVQALNRWYARLHEEALVETWRARCSTLGARIRAGTAEGPLEGVAEEIDSQGALWLRDDGGKRHRLTASEVTLL